MPIRIRDPMEHDPQWRGRKKKDLPPEWLKIAEVLDFELRGHLKEDAPPRIILQAAVAVMRKWQEIASATGKANVEKRHNAEGGAHEKREAIRAAWASGKYSSRDICADEECAGLGISYSTARKALRNTPDPSR